MCSIAGDAAEAGRGALSRPAVLDQLGAAIEELADAARSPDARAQDIAARLARLWEMVADLDPELARRLTGYGG